MLAAVMAALVGELGPTEATQSRTVRSAVSSQFAAPDYSDNRVDHSPTKRPARTVW